MHVQVTVPAFQGRCYHSSTAFNVSPGLTEVVLFGGCPQWPSTDANFPKIANTTVLRFGEWRAPHVSSTLAMWLALFSKLVILEVYCWDVVHVHTHCTTFISPGLGGGGTMSMRL